MKSVSAKYPSLNSYNNKNYCFSKILFLISLLINFNLENEYF